MKRKKKKKHQILPRGTDGDRGNRHNYRPTTTGRNPVLTRIHVYYSDFHKKRIIRTPGRCRRTFYEYFTTIIPSVRSARRNTFVSSRDAFNEPEIMRRHSPGVSGT